MATLPSVPNAYHLVLSSWFPINHQPEIWFAQIIKQNTYVHISPGLSDHLHDLASPVSLIHNYKVWWSTTSLCQYLNFALLYVSNHISVIKNGNLLLITVWNSLYPLQPIFPWRTARTIYCSPSMMLENKAQWSCRLVASGKCSLESWDTNFIFKLNFQSRFP